MAKEKRKKRSSSKEKDKANKKRKTNDLDEDALRRAMEEASASAPAAPPAATNRSSGAQKSSKSSDARAAQDTRGKSKKSSGASSAGKTSNKNRNTARTDSQQPESHAGNKPRANAARKAADPSSSSSSDSSSSDSDTSDSSSSSSSSSSEHDKEPGDDEANRLRPHNPSSGDDTDTQTRKRNAARHNRVPDVQIGNSQLVYRPLAQRQRPASMAPPATPQQQGAAPQDTSRAGRCTPYERQTAPKKPSTVREADFTPPSKAVVQALKPTFRAFIMTQKAYPTIVESAKALDDHIQHALKSGLARKRNRIARLNDTVYVDDLTRHVHGVATSVRNYVLTAAKPVVLDEYLSGYKTGRARKKHVKKLLKNNAFIYEDTKQRLGMFEHPAIRHVIRRAFFVSSQPAYNLGAVREHIPHFKGLPGPLIVLVCVAIAGALTAWSDGYEKQVPFTADTYEDLYNRLIKKFDKLVEGEDGAWFTKKRSDWYEELWASALLPPADYSADDDDSEEEEVLERNRARLRAQRLAAQVEAGPAASAPDASAAAQGQVAGEPVGAAAAANGQDN